ncbi:9888_t:CDS:2 [Acaulospora morrowiae]|uniref:9888_t:CDS:1 n=1 Tax=Acaulospora morrowiae TaxID=94023 RepID=A0A9N9F744_9GLOM|nr:9888_t:CDS:2 [Acaulospora morrowiae]
MDTIVNSYIREIEGYLNTKRIMYEAEGRRDFVPLIDRTVQMVRSIKHPTAPETSTINVTEQSRDSSQHTFERPPEKMYHYAEGEAIDCAICIEQVEAKHAQVRLSCGHIYHLNCLGSHFNHSGDFKCPYCRLEVEKYVKQPRTWEHPLNGPPTPQNLSEPNDIPHPGELDFANFQRGVLQVVNSIFGGRLNLGHPFRNDNGTEEDLLDNEDDEVSDVDQVGYEPRFDGVHDHLENYDSDSDDESNSSDEDPDYDPSSSIHRYRSHRNSSYNGSTDNLSAQGRRARLVMHASNSRIDDLPDGNDDDQDSTDHTSSRSILQERRECEHPSIRSSSSLSRRRGDPSRNSYLEREREDSYLSSSRRNSVRDNETGGLSSRRHGNNSSFIEHAAQMLYERSPGYFERSILDRNRSANLLLDESQRSDTSESSRYRTDDSLHRINVNDSSRYRGNDNINRRGEQYNDDSRSSISPYVHGEEPLYNNTNRLSFVNTLPQTILNASQNSSPSMTYGTPSDSEYEFSNALYRHATTTSRLRNMYQEDSTTEVMDSETSSSSSSEHSEADDDQDDDEVMFTDAGNDMDTSDDEGDGDEDTEEEGYRRCFSRQSSSSSDSPAFSSSDEDEEDDNASIATTTSNLSPSRPEINQHWYKPWSWYAPGTTSAPNTASREPTVNGVDSDATISSGDELYS